MLEKKKALSPNAARGKAVAVPLFSGKLLAAKGHQNYDITRQIIKYIPALMATELAADPPRPVTHEKKHNELNDRKPCPCLYARDSLAWPAEKVLGFVPRYRG